MAGCSPTEAAGVAIYAIVVSMFIYRELTWRNWSSPSSRPAIAQILIIVGAAGAFAWLITTSGFPPKLIAFVDQLSLQTWMLLIVINLILLFVGSVLEPPAAILLLTPLLTPIAYQAGVDPIHFGIIVTVNLAIGMFMPPFGLNLFASHALFGTPLPVLYRGVLPFLAIYLVMLVLITYNPDHQAAQAVAVAQGTPANSCGRILRCRRFRRGAMIRCRRHQLASPQLARQTALAAAVAARRPDSGRDAALDPERSSAMAARRSIV